MDVFFLNHRATTRSWDPGLIAEPPGSGRITVMRRFVVSAEGSVSRSRIEGNESNLQMRMRLFNATERQGDMQSLSILMKTQKKAFIKQFLKRIP
jgi:hypothetical protein